MKHQSQKGVALVITLVMLAVVTLMAITFLAVSRRERAAVTIADDQTVSRLMADAALERVKAEIVTRMMASGSLLTYDFAVSTNFVNTNGFNPSLPTDTPNITNVNYNYLNTGAPLKDETHRLRNIANLQIDPRPPVYVLEGTNLEFRFYLDLNRNARFESNGVCPILGDDGRPVSPFQSANLTGDPEWVGVLAQPDAPHSATNRFVGRYAYMVLPTGKSLDINFVHNNTKAGPSDRQMRSIGYLRNQGVGPWELNLAAFLHDLNTNVSREYDYRGFRTFARNTDSFADALAFLRYRYDGDYRNLAPARNWFYNTNGFSVANSLRFDLVDSYTDGPVYNGVLPLTSDNDDVTAPWAGSDSPKSYFEFNDFFNTNKVPVSWLGNLLLVQNGLSTYNRYTFYRLLSQLGTDSPPPSRTKINLNYNNLPPYNSTNLVPWTPLAFFTNVANRLIEASRTTNFVLFSTGRIATNAFLGEHLIRPGLHVNRIQIYPFNEYSPALHRLLQLAVNLYDATTNNPATPYPQLPTVLRPLFSGSGTNIYISGYEEVTDASFLDRMRLYDLNIPEDRARLTNDPLAVVYNIPFLIGAKKGFPNFNEFALQNVAQLTRKLEIRKPSPGARPNQTNILYQLTLSNQFGLECWNSYTQDFSRALRLKAAGDLFVMVSNTLSPGSILRYVSNHYETNMFLPNWPAREFKVPIHRGLVVASNEVYNPLNSSLQFAGTNLNFIPGLGFYVPYINIYLTNRCYYALIDQSVVPNRIVDFVCLGNMGTALDLTRELAGRAQSVSAAGGLAEPANLWGTNTAGLQNQVEISLGNIPVSSQQWRSFSQVSAEGRDKEKSIDRLRLFCGLTPLVYQSGRALAELSAEVGNKLAIQAGFSPTRKIYQDLSWQANDPLVHYTLGDLLDPFNRPGDPNRTNAIRFTIPPEIALTNSNLGILNERYRPWGGNPNQSVDRIARDLRFKDPLITQSDDWQFPTNKFPNIGWIGRVHRGTPWQTVYLKADIAPTNDWFRWAGSYGTHPTNDWNIVECFTTALNDNAARGLLGVNQANLAAWSAVLNGLMIAIPTNDVGGVQSILIGPHPPPPIATNLVPDIVAGINRTRTMEIALDPAGRGVPLFHRMGRILATPELTFGTVTVPSPSPGLYHRWIQYMPRDEVLECIPQHILSLIKEDEPRFVVYAFGQALREAPNSLYLGSGTFNRLCTNYQVTAEFVSKSVIRIEGTPLSPRAVVESYNELVPE